MGGFGSDTGSRQTERGLEEGGLRKKSVGPGRRCSENLRGLARAISAASRSRVNERRQEILNLESPDIY